MNTIIFTMTHKKFIPPKNPIFVPLQVGRDLHGDLGYIGDNSGDSISKWNPYFSELTGMYWVWKNFSMDGNVGICHYRRFLTNENGKVLDESDYNNILSSYDLVTTKKVKLNNSYYDGYAKNHHIKDLDETGRVIAEKFPEYHKDFIDIVNGKQTYFGNMIVCNKSLYDQYCEWLFGILLEVKNRVDVENYDDYHKRVFGFISEILLLVYTTHNGLKVFECMVGMPEEKVETREVKEKLTDYFRKKDLEGAEQCFKDALSRRPDILMEASDLGGELMLALQVITTCQQELKSNQKCILNKIQDFNRLIGWMKKVNEMTKLYRMDKLDTKEWEQFCSSENVSEKAVHIASLVIENGK